jgi:RecA-family ATPase
MNPPVPVHAEPDESPLDAGRVDIPWQAIDAIESWDRTLANLENRAGLGLAFTRGATEILRLAEPLPTPEAWLQIVDDLHSMGQKHGLSDATVQGLMAAAIAAPPDRSTADIVAIGNRDDRPEPPPADGPEAYGLQGDGEPALAAPEPALAFTTPLDWPNGAPPPVDWLADHRIPRGDVTTLHGDGGAGKTDIACQLAEACATRAPYWLGHEITPGPVVILSAEEPQRELRRRFWLHSQRDGFELADLADLHLWFPGDVAGAVFAVPDRSGIMQPTPLSRSIADAIASSAPVLVIVDNVAATFTGNQNDRVMVRSYVNLGRTIARQASRPAVLLLDHPSLSGLTNGSGRGGNMDWRNAVRSALYLRVPEDKTEADAGIRVLETQKNNYGPTGQPVRLQWATGGLQLEQGTNSLVRLAEDTKVDDLFLRLLDKFSAQGRDVRSTTGSGYAPAEFEDDPEAKIAGVKAKAIKVAMARLFEAGKITTVQGKRSKHIERAAPL